jgi:tRNA splicing ligase
VFKGTVLSLFQLIIPLRDFSAPYKVNLASLANSIQRGLCCLNQIKILTCHSCDSRRCISGEVLNELLTEESGVERTRQSRYVL